MPVNGVLEKSAKIPLSLLGGALTALGLHSGYQDVKEGLRRGSLGQTLWGAAQVPLSLGTFGITKMMNLPRIVQSGGLLSKVPGMARIAKYGPSLGRAGIVAEQGAKRLGGAMVSPLRYAANRMGMTGTSRWLGGIGVKRTVGTMGAFLGVPMLMGFGQGEQQQDPGDYGQYNPWQYPGGAAPGGYSGMPNVRNVAPGVRFLGMPTPGPQGQQYAPIENYEGYK